MVEENDIIGKLIEEDEKQSLDLNFTQNEEIGAWKGISKIEISKKLKSYSNLSPNFYYPNIPRPQKLMEKLPKIAQIAKNTSFYPAKNYKSDSKKAKLTQKLITINNQKDINYQIPHNPSEQGQFFKTPSPTTFKGLKILNKSKKKNFSLVPEFQDPLNFFHIPEHKQIKYKKVDSVGYFSPIYDKYFNHSGSNKRIIGQSELDRKDYIKNSKSKNEIKKIFKQESGAHIKNFKLPNERSKILKKFLLSPIYLNMCKYNSVLNN